MDGLDHSLKVKMERERARQSASGRSLSNRIFSQRVIYEPSSCIDLSGVDGSGLVGLGGWRVEEKKRREGGQPKEVRRLSQPWPSSLSQLPPPPHQSFIKELFASSGISLSIKGCLII